MSIEINRVDTLAKLISRVYYLLEEMKSREKSCTLACYDHQKHRN